MHRHLSAHDDRRTRTRALLRSAHDASAPSRRHLLDEVIRLNMPVARAIASPYRGRGVPTEDLEQVAYAALVRATHCYEPDRGDDFLSYAVPTIRGEIRRHFRDCGWMVRPPRRLQEIQTRALTARDHLAALGEPTTPAAIAESIDAEPADVEEALTARGCFVPTSLDQPRGPETHTTIADLVPAEDHELERAEAAAIIGPAVAKLDDRDRAIVRMRFYEDLTQREIGDRLGVTQMHVSRLLSRIVADLREDVTGCA